MLIWPRRWQTRTYRKDYGRKKLIIITWKLEWRILHAQVNPTENNNNLYNPDPDAKTRNGIHLHSSSPRTTTSYFIGQGPPNFANSYYLTHRQVVFILNYYFSNKLNDVFIVRSFFPKTSWLLSGPPKILIGDLCMILVFVDYRFLRIIMTKDLGGS